MKAGVCGAETQRLEEKVGTKPVAEVDVVKEMETWIGSLINGEGYFEPSGFESSIVLYSTPLSESFLLTLIDGLGRPAPFRVGDCRSRYAELIRSIGRVSGNESAYWFYITDPDNCMSILAWLRPDDSTASSTSNLEWFEHSPAVEGGMSYLGLAGESRRWMLYHEYRPGEMFTISIHGPQEFCRRVAEGVGVVV